MRFAGKNISKDKKKDIARSIVNIYIKNDKLVKSLGRSHAPLDAQYSEDILFGESIENLYPEIDFSEFSRHQITSIWKLVQEAVLARKMYGIWI
jgi:hypothetical protein